MNTNLLLMQLASDYFGWNCVQNVHQCRYTRQMHPSESNPSKPINNARWEDIQKNAKTKALEAVARGSPNGLTRLELGYYHSIKNPPNV